ncbi:uncharacterized protein JN550_000886 [Neoarthrinium moseri]|uniref:uncharacterized protein n=1 Tax=Neoarthrinium moseri TaxID=1658444 RepID=UPI001FDC9F4A|nr:uncharacterized protein JN550_000886 [Neoarthrinium moseri]KAI1876814.1 hypothetical protein JN550_000886 [Neoarthrinium moseri]
MALFRPTQLQQDSSSRDHLEQCYSIEQTSLNSLLAELQTPEDAQGIVLRRYKECATGLHSGECDELSTSRQTLSAWYRNESTTRWSNPAKQAFDNAVEVLKKEMTPSDCDLIWLRGKNSMEDVQNALFEARAKYQSHSGKSKVRSILASCSSRVVYYAPVFDTLSQHYPEYVSLAWGAFKFFFTGIRRLIIQAIINHEELLAEFARAIANIANVLPRTKFLCELYPTKEMQEAIASVYTKILDFVLESVKWYKKSKLQHALSAVVSPYKLSFKNIVDEIAERSRCVDDLANAAFKAELRDVHLEVRTLRSEMSYMQNHFLSMNQTLVENQMIQRQMTIHQRQQNMLLLEWQIGNLRQILESSDSEYGNAEQMLGFGRSLRNRRRLRTPTHMPHSEIPKLEAWASSQQSTLLIAQGHGIKNSPMDFAVDFLDVVIDAQAPAVWALPAGSDHTPTLTDIVQSLVLQTLLLLGRTTGSTAEPLSVSIQDLSSASSTSDWFTILDRCFRCVQRVFVVVDTGLIHAACRIEDNRMVDMDADRFVRRLGAIMTSRTQGWVKVMMVSWSSDVFEKAEAELSIDILQIVTDRGAAQERKLWNPRLKAMARRHSRMSMYHFRQAVGRSDWDHT